MGRITLTIDGRTVASDPGMTIMDAARQAGIEIPALCYLKDLAPYGACRLCMVEIARGTRSRVVASCAYPVEEGLMVQTKSPKVEKIRRLMIELLLPLAPYNRLIGDLAGEYGITSSRFTKKIDACILCGLCVRHALDVQKKDIIGFVGRGVDRHVSWVPREDDRPYEPLPECAAVCPTGVFRLKELSRREELFVPGHRLCAGCGAATVIRQALLAVDGPVVIATATGCVYVSTATYPYSAWKCNWIHSAFENAAATISGIEAAYRSLQRQGKVTRHINFIALAGDGGTYDIGLQSLSGALERGHRFLYMCYNNEAYMNTGIQRSGATPLGASTTTTPPGESSFGKRDARKDLTGIIAAHNIPYVAQATPAHWEDLQRKVRLALSMDGPSFINVLSPCHRGWRCEMKDSIALARLATDTCYWPLYEVVKGEWRLTYMPERKLPVTEWMKPQGRFRHLFMDRNRHIIDREQARIDKEWEILLKKCGEKAPATGNSTRSSLRALRSGPS